MCQKPTPFTQLLLTKSYKNDTIISRSHTFQIQISILHFTSKFFSLKRIPICIFNCSSHKIKAQSNDSTPFIFTIVPRSLRRRNLSLMENIHKRNCIQSSAQSLVLQSKLHKSSSQSLY